MLSIVFSQILTFCEKSPAIMRIAVKDFARKFDFKDLKCPIKIKDIYKVEKKNCIVISVFRYENRQKFPTYLSKNIFKKQVNI